MILLPKRWGVVAQAFLPVGFDLAKRMAFLPVVFDSAKRMAFLPVAFDLAKRKAHRQECLCY
jgi:hypothetical protein